MVISAVVIGAATELAKTHRLLGALLISLPLTSLLSFSWIYYEERDPIVLSRMSMEVFYLVLASLPFFPLFSFLLSSGFSFISAMTLALLGMSLVYFLFTLRW